MTNPTDLIRRGDAYAACELYPPDDWDNDERDGFFSATSQCRAAIRKLPAHPVQEPPGPGVTAGATGLLPCPFCGNEPYRDSSADCTGGPMVGCLCGAHVSGYRLQYDADAAWNLRCAPPVGARVTGWQPIETAPKDGTVIVAISGVAGHNGYSIIFWDEDGWAGYTAEDEKRIVRFPPALWCDIPEPPAALLPAGEGEE